MHVTWQHTVFVATPYAKQSLMWPHPTQSCHWCGHILHKAVFDVCQLATYSPYGHTLHKAVIDVPLKIWQHKAFVAASYTKQSMKCVSWQHTVFVALPYKKHCDVRHLVTYNLCHCTLHKAIIDACHLATYSLCGHTLHTIHTCNPSVCDPPMCVCVCVCVELGVCVCVWVSEWIQATYMCGGDCDCARARVFQCVPVSLCFVWLSMSSAQKPVNMCVSGYTSILIYTHTVYMCVCVCVCVCVQETLWVRGHCVSVCQFHFALYD